MTGWLLVGALFGLAGMLAYVVASFRVGKSPDLTGAMNVFAGVAGFVASIRMLFIIFLGDLEAQLLSATTKSTWDLTPADASFIFIGAIAMGWVSIQTAYKSWSATLAATVSPHPITPTPQARPNHLPPA